MKMSVQAKRNERSMLLKLSMDGALAIADLENGGFFEGMAPGAVSVITSSLQTTPRAEWGAWVKEKLMKTANANVWGFKAGVDY